jgi:hypothetical protein
VNANENLNASPAWREDNGFGRTAGVFAPWTGEALSAHHCDWRLRSMRAASLQRGARRAIDNDILATASAQTVRKRRDIESRNGLAF